MMPKTKPAQEPWRKTQAIIDRLYRLLLFAYPQQFRQRYGLLMAQAFRDSCRDRLHSNNSFSLFSFCLFALYDLVSNACLERIESIKRRIIMGQERYGQGFPLRHWIAIGVTGITFLISLVASLNLYLLEDANPLAQIAYRTSPLLRFSYDGVYLSALAAGVAMCALIGYALVRHTMLVTAGLAALTVLVMLGGFGGLLVHHATTFLVFLILFAVLTLGSFLLGRLVATHYSRLPGTQPRAVLSSCVAVNSILFVNVVALVLHTLSLNPVSRMLYMQGQITGTHLNFSLLAMVLAFVGLMACIVCLRQMLRFFPQNTH
jgi:hypothetical protein